MYSIRYLDILGHRDEPVPHTFFQQEKAPSHLAIILPGMGYTSHMPLLYYPARLMLNRGADVLQLQYEYSRKDDFASLDGEGKMRWLMTDVSKACRAALERRSYGKITLIGKSMGTRAMGHLLTTQKEFGEADAVWLTPVLRSETLRQQITEWGRRSLFVIGTADPHYDETHLEEIQRATKGEVLVIEGGDHSLEIDGDVLESLRAIERVMRAFGAFFSS